MVESVSACLVQKHPFVNSIGSLGNRLRLRLSSDNFIRCFSPYDCDQPRVLIHAGELTGIACLDAGACVHNTTAIVLEDVAT